MSAGGAGGSGGGGGKGFLSGLFARRGSAPVARDRLQILLAHERAGGSEGQSDLIARLREEILEVIARHVPIGPRPGADQARPGCGHDHARDRTSRSRD